MFLHETIPKYINFFLHFISLSQQYWRSCAKDFGERFVGHCNTTTDIKEANFFGSDGSFVIAGSDDGNFYIWERPTNKIVAVYKGDTTIVNCVQPHPTLCMLATSGIDHEIRLWSPKQEGFDDANRVSYYDTTVVVNQQVSSYKIRKNIRMILYRSNYSSGQNE